MAASTRFSASRPIEQVQSIDAPFGSAWRRARLTAEERVTRGKAARNQTPPIEDFSMIYADQNERDYVAFAAAVKSGKLTAQTGI